MYRRQHCTKFPVKEKWTRQGLAINPRSVGRKAYLIVQFKPLKQNLFSNLVQSRRKLPKFYLILKKAGGNSEDQSLPIGIIFNSR